MNFTASIQNLSLCSDLMARYLRYVLITSVHYSGSKCLDWQIALLTLITSLLLKAGLKETFPFHIIIDCMTDIIGSDFRQNPPEPEVAPSFDKSLLLLSDPNAQNIASALNSLDPLPRLLLVLRYMDCLTTEQLTGIFNESTPDINLNLINAEKLFIDAFSSFCYKPLLTDDVPLLLADLDDSLDLSCAGALYDSVLAYLSDSRDFHPPFEPVWRNQNAN